MVQRAEDWRWGSLAHRFANGDDPLRAVFCDGPTPLPRDWTTRVNRAQTGKEIECLRTSVHRGQPYGSPVWQASTAALLGLQSTFRRQGRPRKQKDEDDDGPNDDRKRSASPFVFPQADQILFLKRAFLTPQSRYRWYPRLMIWGGEGGHLELFARAGSARGLEPLKVLFRVKSLKELLEKLRAGRDEHEMGRILQSDWGRYDYNEVLNMAQLSAIVDQGG